MVAKRWVDAAECSHFVRQFVVIIIDGLRPKPDESGGCGADVHRRWRGAGFRELVMGVTKRLSFSICNVGAV